MERRVFTTALGLFAALVTFLMTDGAFADGCSVSPWTYAFGQQTSASMTVGSGEICTTQLNKAVSNGGVTIQAVRLRSSPGHGDATTLGLGLKYRAKPGYTGPDSLIFEVVGANGKLGTVQLQIAVSSAPDAQDASHRLVEAVPWLVQNRGPDKAKGVIYFTHGFDRHSPMVDEYRPIHFFIKTLNDEGWDVIAAKYPFSPSYDERSVNLAYLAAPQLQQRARGLRTQGYKQVIFMGQSWGSWSIMLAAKDDQLAADAIVLLVPATWGERTTAKGAINYFFELNKTEFGPLLAGIKKPVAAVLFAADDYDPGGRGEIAKAIFRRSNTASLLIDSPPGFKGHFSGWLPVFDFIFGSCLGSFIEARVTSACELPALDDADFRSIVKKDQVRDFDSRKIGAANEIPDGAFVVYRTGGGPAHAEFKQGQSPETLRAKGAVDGKFSFSAGHVCYLDECLVLVRWDETHLVGFDPATGQARSWWIRE
jgi:pimeloyl-ACP methyl ester carboxylesterase